MLCKMQACTGHFLSFFQLVISRLQVNSVRRGEGSIGGRFLPARATNRPMNRARSNEYPVYAEIVAADEVQWLAPGAPLPTEPHWPRAETAPIPGTEHLVKLARSGMPFAVGQERWLVFVPELAALNGWDSHPDTIPASAFVRAVLRAVERENPILPDDNWLRFDIAEVIRFDQIEQRFPPRPLARLDTWQLSTGALTRFQDWELWWAPHDDAGYWLLARLREDGAHVVAAGEWLYGAMKQMSEGWAGHVVLPHAAWRDICGR